MRSGAPTDARARSSVLLLTGIGLTAAAALRWIAPLKERFQVLAAPLGAFADDKATEDLPVTTADEAVASLDAARVEQAHVVALSFGAVIALEIAIRHPRRVCSLVLGSASAGGGLYVRPEPAVRDFVRRLSAVSTEEGLWAAVPYLYAPATRRRHAPLIGEDIARRLTRPLDPRSYRRQHAIARAHDASALLGQITAPTLVMHGEQDRILPLDNGRRLADAIPGAKFVALPGGAHAFPTDVPDSSRELVSFLLANSRRPASPAARRNARATRA